MYNDNRNRQKRGVKVNEFGEYLRQLRGERSLRDIHEATGVSHTYLSTLEKGFDPRTKKKRKPSFDVLKKLADFYDVSYIELLIKADYIEEAEKENLEDIDNMLKNAKWVQASPEEIKKMMSDQKNLLKDKEFNIEDLLTDDYHIRFKGRLLAPEEKQKILKLIDISFN